MGGAGEAGARDGREMDPGHARHGVRRGRCMPHAARAAQPSPANHGDRSGGTRTCAWCAAAVPRSTRKRARTSHKRSWARAPTASCTKVQLLDQPRRCARALPLYVRSLPSHVSSCAVLVLSTTPSPPHLFTPPAPSLHAAGIHRQTGQEVAIKEISKKRLKQTGVSKQPRAPEACLAHAG